MTNTANAPERDNMPDTIMAWPDFDGCITGAWSANQYSDERAREYISRTHCDELVAAAYVDAAQRIEQCLWSYHWYLDGESVDPEDLSRGILKRTPDNARTALTAYGERMKAEGAKEDRKKWQKSVRDTFDAMCAMRNAINEHVPMPSLESDLLHGPENSVFCAAVAESVIEAQQKAQEKIARLTEALDEKQDGGKDFWMNWAKKRLEINRAMFLRDAKMALAGDMRALRNRVELMEAEPVQLVLSAALQENANG